MPDRTWKARERQTAVQIGGERTWKDLPDAESDTLSIECKYRKTLPRWLWAAVDQARHNASEGKFPAVRLMQKYKRRSIVVMDWDDWLQYFDVPSEGAEGGMI